MNKEKTQGFSLKNFTACIIGVGGTGTNIAVHLAGAGIGKLYLFDFDKISESNLNRQFLYSYEDTKKQKVFVAGEKLKKYAPDCEIEAFNEKITKENMPEEILRSCDIVFLAVDNKSARKCVCDFCVKNKIPLSLTGIDGFYINTYLYIPDSCACPRCAGMTDGKTAKFSVSSIAGIAGALAVENAQKYLLTKDKTYGGKVFVFDENEFYTLKIKKTKNCEMCNFSSPKGETT